MTANQIQIRPWRGAISTPARLVMTAGLGLSFAIGFLSAKPHFSHTVNQPSCHSEHHNDKIARISTSVRHCKGCGHLKDQSAFASKGRDRPSVLCKGCDNQRRRSSYAPKVTVPDWDHVTITLESAPGPELDTAKLVMDLLEEFHLQDRTQQQEKSIVDSIIVGGTSLDDLLGS